MHDSSLVSCGQNAVNATSNFPDSHPSSSSAPSASAPNPPSPYVNPPALPAQEAADGILFDYCDGLRVKFPDFSSPSSDPLGPRGPVPQAPTVPPASYRGPWLLRVEEEESGLVSFQGVCRAGAYMATRKKWFCKHKFTIWRVGGPASQEWNEGNGGAWNGENMGGNGERADVTDNSTDVAWNGGANAPIFSHTFNAEGKNVLLQMAVGTLGDSIAWLPSVVRFGERHRCKIFVSVNAAIKELFAPAYPHITFLTKEEADALCRVQGEMHKIKFNNCDVGSPSGENNNNHALSPAALPSKGASPSFYAAYRIGLFFKDEENDLEPSDFRLCGLHHAAAHILGLPESENPPRLPASSPHAAALLPSNYVCIATKASMQCKFWNHPTGWVTVIDFLKKSGYRALCIDRERDGGGVVPNPMPRGCEDFTGNRPLAERMELIRHAAFFIGLSSGLSWLAWACRVPVVLIGGFSEPLTEFQTPYRVLSPHACHGCWNDRRFPFDHKDFMWCPRHKGTDRQFECSRLITPEQVISVIKKIPVFKERTGKED